MPAPAGGSVAARRPVLPVRGDLVAGLSVAVILIPQALAYAEIAGMPPYVGLYAAALPTIVAAFLASSRYLQTGPVAMTSLLTFGALSTLAVPASGEYVALATLLALIVGVVRLGLGFLRGGVVAYLMSQPVLVGFTSAAAILIVASQLPTALGAPAAEGGLLGRAYDALRAPGDWSWEPIAVSVVTVAIVVWGRLVHRLFPGVLIAVVFGVAVGEIFDYPGSMVGAIPEGLPPLSLSFPWSSLPELLLPGVVIALVGFAEPAAIARTFAAQDRDPWDPNREFLSQGVANLAAAISGAFPVGGSFARSSVAHLAGAHSRWAGGIAGLVVLLFLPFARILEALPRAVLAAIVIVAVARMIRIVTLVRLIKVTWGQSVVAWGTFVATLALSPRIDLGVLIGIGLATAVHLRREALIRVDTRLDGDVLVLRPSGVLYFGSAPRLGQTLIDELAAHHGIRRVVVDLERLGRIDYTGAVALRAFFDECDGAGLETELRNVPPHALGTLNRSWGTRLAEVLAED